MHIKLAFNTLQKTYDNSDSYTFKHNEVLIDKPMFSRIVVLKLTKTPMYKLYYDKLQPFFGQEKLELNYMDTDSFVISIKTAHFIEDLYNLEEVFDFSNLNKKTI